MGRDGLTGLPNKLIPCPAGARNTSDSCQKSRCAYVSIPLRNRSTIRTPTKDEYLWKICRKFILVILILIVLKIVFVICGACCTLFV
jgi:hypothetical protein